MLSVLCDNWHFSKTLLKWGLVGGPPSCSGERVQGGGIPALWLISLSLSFPRSKRSCFPVETFPVLSSPISRAFHLWGVRGLHFPPHFAVGWDHETGLGQWVVGRSKACHFLSRASPHWREASRALLPMLLPPGMFQMVAPPSAWVPVGR